ncbi:MAG: amidohydrolase family protein [Actinomycetota bacterium]|nr:amidohydrolase family protein [Actinomycetota bacterium]
MTAAAAAAAARPTRVVDAHVHLWDPANTDWYPYLSDRRQLDLGDVTGMARRFDVPTYLVESAGWNVQKMVNVAAATGPHSIDETLAIDRQADVDGHPAAIIGGVTPTKSAAEAVGQIDRQMEASRFRGVRPMGAFEDPLPPVDVLRALQDRSLVFELMAHPDRLQQAARGLAGFEQLVVVVEHAGWPRSSAPDEFALWKVGMEALAGLGDNVVCKLSGLAMPLGSMTVDAFAPWLEFAIETFGVDRCMFASNFPVDGLHGTYDELYSTFAAVTAWLDDSSRENLFAANAERIYRFQESRR